MVVTKILLCVFVIELWWIWWMQFHEDSFYWAWNFTSFYTRVFCGWLCYICFGQSSVVTETKLDGEITRQVFIG